MPSITPVCSRCGRALNYSVSFCPDCGMPQTQQGDPMQSARPTYLVVQQAKPRWAAKVVLSCFILIAVFALITALRQSSSKGASESGTDSVSTTSSNPPIANMGDTVNVGYWSYSVRQAQWSNFLGRDQFDIERPDAKFLILSMVVRNNDRTASTLPPVKLVNDSGQEFSESSAGSLMDGVFGPLKELNPGVESRGMVVFDVPPGQYRVLLSGGLRSDETAQVSLKSKPDSSTTEGNTRTVPTESTPVPPETQPEPAPVDPTLGGQSVPPSETQPPLAGTNGAVPPQSTPQ